MHESLKYNYNYIGTDISFNRLRIAKYFTKSNFISCSALNLPFKSNIFDVVIGFGVFHHLPDLKIGFDESIRCIKDEGLLGFSEPVEKPKILNEDGRIAKLLATYEHSEHDNDINLEKTKIILKIKI